MSRTAVLSNEAGALRFRARVTRDPVDCYLSKLTPADRLTMGYKLRYVARLFGHADASGFQWSGLRYEHVLAVRSHLVEKGLAPATVNAHLSALVGVAVEAWRLGLLSPDELQRIKSVERARGERLPPGRVLGRDEIARLLEACKADARGVCGARDAAVLALLFGAGLRRCEPCRVDVGGYSAESGELRLTGKGGRERRVYLAGGAALAVGAWVGVRGSKPGPLVLALDRGGLPALPTRGLSPSSVDSIVRRRAAEAKVVNFSTHDARRTFITNLLERGVDVFTVQKLAGHADPKTTQLYDRRDDEAKRRAATLVELPY